MKVNPHIFRGYDLRGLVNTDLSEELFEHLGKAHGTLMLRRGISDAVVARDSRGSSPAYCQAFVRGLTWTGVDVSDIGLQLVGTFYWSQYYLKRRGGAMITASHNPLPYNGAKFAIDFSETLVSDGMEELRRMVEVEDYQQGLRPGPLRSVDITGAYIDDMLRRVPLAGRKLRVVVDAGNATAGLIAPELLRRAGCEVIEYNTKLDPSFPLGTPDPTELKVAERLAAEVRESGADLGLSYDPDGDRVGIVDERGGIIWNDVLVALFAVSVLRQHPGSTIMFNTLCSKVVTDTIIANGGKPFMWRTGHSFLKKKNQEVGAAFIGELSGHFFFSKDYYNHDDGLYSSLRLLQLLMQTGQKLSEAVAALPHYESSPEIKLYCDDAKKVALVEKLRPALTRDYPAADIIDDERAGDGIRLELPDRMFVVRYSQNGPYLTVKFEGRTEEQYEKLRTYLRSLLHAFDEIDWSSNINVNTEALDSRA